jgi:hypothetical protein
MRQAHLEHPQFAAMIEDVLMFQPMILLFICVYLYLLIFELG